MNDFFTDLNEIFNPQFNPMFSTAPTCDDNIEDVEYEEIKD